MPLSGVTAYSAINATVRALYSTVLSPEVRYALVQSPNYNALLDGLTKTAYAPYLDINRQALTPRRTVYQLRWHLAKAYEKLIRLAPDSGQQLLIRLWHRYEVDNLKATLRGVATGASWDEVRHLLSPMFKHITLTQENMQRMLVTGDIVRAIERTRSTPYYETLTHAVERYEIEKNLFPLEVALDLDYWRGVWQTVNQLKGQDHNSALQLVGTTIDVENLLWAIRYRVYHNLSVQEIINYTLPFGYHVDDDAIRAIANGKDVIAVVQRVFPKVEGLNELPVQKRTEIAPPKHWLTLLEHALHRYIIGLCHRMFIGNPFHIGIPVAYLMLIEYELQDLTAIVEAKASGLPFETLASVIDI